MQIPQSVRDPGPAHAPASGADLAAIRARVADALERLSGAVLAETGHDLAGHGSGRSGGDRPGLEERIRFLGQVAAGLASLEPHALPAAGAGFGSTVVVEDADRGGRESYTLMVGSIIDIEAGQVSLASPIGRALLGRRPGEIAIVETPQRQRRLRVVSVTTLADRLARDSGGDPEP